MRKAHNRIAYQNGEFINGIKFISEASPYVNPTTGKEIRRGLFQCPFCEKTFKTTISKIRIGHTQSCGCYQMSQTSNSNSSHGLSKHPIHKIWARIKQRCTDCNSPSYLYYGGRGITICDEWKNDFKAFYDYTITLPNYGEEGLTIDRINNNGNYEPGNVRWANWHIQNANKRKPKNNTSGYVGVTRTPYNWYSSIRINRELIHLGSFKTPKEAAEARNKYIKDNNLHEYKIQTI